MGYRVRASRVSMLVGVGVVVAGLVEAGLAVVALLSGWDPYFEQRLGPVGVILAGACGVGVAGWIALRTLGLVIRGRILLDRSDGGDMWIWTSNGPVTLKAAEVERVDVVSTAGGRKLQVWSRSGETYRPMFEPDGVGWDQVARELETFDAGDR